MVQFLEADEVRSKFISFFESKEHVFWKSSPVVPRKDHTLLFINAGMNQFKDIFIGNVDKNTPMGALKRATNSQKCIRAGGKHNDLDDVGKDVYHHTFFEMLGNWSFMDFFKVEAIDMAWEFLTQIIGLDPDRLYVSYYEEDPKNPGVPTDEETKNLWKKYVPDNRIIPFGAKDNFWEMGNVGPCGPCTEIHYDRIGGRCVPELVGADDPDVLEIWNLVFMQYYRSPGGALSKLPKGSVDTGMGLERLVSIIQNTTSNYDTDIFVPILKRIEEVIGCKPYQGKVGIEDKDQVDMAYRVVADHIRTLCIAIVDGALPSNEGRGYVIRRILRRAVRYGRSFLGAPTNDRWLSKIVPIVCSTLSVYEELKQKQELLERIIGEEEAIFSKTLDTGIARFQKRIDQMEPNAKLFPGSDAFELYTRYGFPLDLIAILAEEKNLILDMEEYERLFEEHKRLSDNSGFKAIDSFVITPEIATQLQSKGINITVDVDKYEWNAEDDGPIITSKLQYCMEDANSQYKGLIYERTTFYAEAGGQIGDIGVISNEHFDFNVMNTIKSAGYVIHIGQFSRGDIKVGDEAKLRVDYVTRGQCAKNHTATHMLNFALRSVTKESCDQKGSIVEPSKLRFDFEFGRALTTEQLMSIESIIRNFIKDEKNVYCEELPLKEAIELPGLRAVAGDDYPDPVRVVSVGVAPVVCLGDKQVDYGSKTSLEFCGGTHLSNTKQIQEFVISSEESVARGIRRIVALTGQAAKDSITFSNDLLCIAEGLESKSGNELQDALTHLKSQTKDHRDVLSRIVMKQITSLIDVHHQRRLEELKGQTKLLLKVAEAKANMLAEKHDADTSLVVDASDLLGDIKAMDAFIKTFTKKKDASLCIISSTPEITSVLCKVPKKNTGKIQANKWVEHIFTNIDARVGGKEENARGSVKGPIDIDANSLVEAARQFISH